MSQAADDVWVTHAIERGRFVLKILDQRPFEIRILITLKQDIECLDDHPAKAFVSRAQIAGRVNLSIASATEALLDIIAAIESAL